jgi:[ribosomal protein S5]-alanine N-acetyltransferase
LEQIKTPRLLLRPLQDEDAEQLCILRSDPEVNRYIDRPKEFTLPECRGFIKKIREATRSGKSFYWAICPQPENVLGGTICIWNISDDRKSAEIGYELMPNFQGKGFMKEAVPAVIKFCFENTSIAELWGVTHFANQASIKILEQYEFAYVPEKIDEGPDLHFYRLKKGT